MPVLLGMTARVLHPDLPERELALPSLLLHDLPRSGGARPGGGLLGGGQRRRRRPLHAVDVAVAGSLQALRQSRRDRPAGPQGRALGGGARRHPRRGDGGGRAVRHRRAQHLLHPARRQPVRAGRRGALRAAGGAPEALAAVAAGIAAMVAVHLATRGRGFGIVTPAFAGIALSIVGCAAMVLVRRRRIA